MHRGGLSIRQLLNMVSELPGSQHLDSNKVSEQVSFSLLQTNEGLAIQPCKEVSKYRCRLFFKDAQRLFDELPSTNRTGSHCSVVEELLARDPFNAGTEDFVSPFVINPNLSIGIGESAEVASRNIVLSLHHIGLQSPVVTDETRSRVHAAAPLAKASRLAA